MRQQCRPRRPSGVRCRPLELSPTTPAPLSLPVFPSMWCQTLDPLPFFLSTRATGPPSNALATAVPLFRPVPLVHARVSRSLLQRPFPRCLLSTDGDREARDPVGLLHCRHRPPSSVSWAIPSFPSKIWLCLTIAVFPGAAGARPDPAAHRSPPDVDYHLCAPPPLRPRTSSCCSGEPSPPPPHQARCRRPHSAHAAFF
jgi:hypothetical protein